MPKFFVLCFDHGDSRNNLLVEHLNGMAAKPLGFPNACEIAPGSWAIVESPHASLGAVYNKYVQIGAPLFSILPTTFAGGQNVGYIVNENALHWVGMWSTANPVDFLSNEQVYERRDRH